MNMQIQAEGLLIRNTSAHTGKYNFVYAVTDVVFNSVTCSIKDSAGTNWSGVTLQAGQFIPIGATSIQLTSGTLLAIHE